MKPFKHLSKHERDRLAVLRAQGKSLREIGRMLNRPHTTLSRELQRNGRPKRRDGYFSHKAQERAIKRRHSTHGRPRLTSHALRLEIEHLLMKGWSPEIISGHLKKKGRARISHETIYQWVYGQAPHLIGYLVRSHPSRRRRWAHQRRGKTHIPSRVSIQERPPVVQSRQEPGHWETDLVVGRGPSALQVTVERTTRLTRLKKVPDKSARESSEALRRILSGLPEKLRKSLTYDNGFENVNHVQLNEALGTKSYFCEPYHSWEKGTVENTNGLIRRFYPKRTDFSTITDSEIQRTEDWLNERPRKCLQFQTSAEVFKDLGGAITP